MKMEMAAAEQANHADSDQIKSNNIVQKFGHHQDQKAGNQGNHRDKRKMNIHRQSFMMENSSDSPLHN